MTCPAAFNQVAYRGRNDDGNETTATWLHAQNVGWYQLTDVNFRVRLEVQETAGCLKNNFTTIQLEYNLNAAGWVSVTASSSVVRSSASPNVADGAETTDQLTVGTGTFTGGGGFDEVNGIAGSTAMDINASGHFEVEYCVQLRAADVAEGDSIQLRVTDGGTGFAAYDATPTLIATDKTLLYGLRSYWKLDEASGAALDAHADNDLTDNNTVGTATGIINGGRDFERGNTESFSIADNASLSFVDEGFSISCWIKIEASASPNGMRVVAKGPGGTSGEYQLKLSDTLVPSFTTVNPSSSEQTVTWSAALSIATWYHIVGWHDHIGNVIGITVDDGTPVTIAWTSGGRDSTGAFYIGNSADTFSAFDGVIDEVGLWSKVLSATEITDLYNSGAGFAYPFDPVSTAVASHPIARGIRLGIALGITNG